MPQKEEGASPPNGPGRDAPPTWSPSSALPGVGKIDGSCENHITISHMNKYYCFVVYVMNWWYSDLAGEKGFFSETKLIGALYKKSKNFEVLGSFFTCNLLFKNPAQNMFWGCSAFWMPLFFLPWRRSFGWNFSNDDVHLLLRKFYA